MSKEKNILIMGTTYSGKKTALLNIKDKNTKFKTASYRSAIINDQKIQIIQF